METVLLFLIFHVAGALVVQVFQDLRERGAQILGRNVRIGPFPEFGNFDIAPVGQVERGPVPVRGILGGIGVFLHESADIFLGAKDGGDDQLVGIQSLGGEGILEVPADAVQEFRRGRDLCDTIILNEVETL